MEDLWENISVNPQATTVRNAFSIINNNTSEMVSPKFSSDDVKNRMKAIPHDGGSWIDLLKHPNHEKLLTNSMKKILQAVKIGSYPDVYGRMSWNKPSPTIKRECSHIGNGRYAHPEEDRLCTVREMATLQGFPIDFQFDEISLSNKYRHIGDAVPPLISYQLSCITKWILTGIKPALEDCILEGTSLSPSDLIYEANYYEAS